MAAKPKITNETIDIVRVERGSIDVYLRGTSPLIYNSMNLKAMSDLLLPPKKKTQADKAATLKHDPLAEYRRSVYRTKGDDAQTRLFVPAVSFKSAMMSAAIDLPGATKAQTGRLSYVEGQEVAIYGTPQLRMDCVKMGDIGRTADVRTRAILPEWCCRLTILYTRPLLNASSIVNLLAASGMNIGVGDYRQEKGKGNFGLFDIVPENDVDWQRISATQGRAVQDAALEEPVCYNAESEELLAWFQNEVKRRGDDDGGRQVRRAVA